MNSTNKILLLAMAVVGLSACSIDASLQNITDSASKAVSITKSSGIISGSSQNGRTTDNAYTIQSSVGSYLSVSAKQTASDPSNPNGTTYRVYSSVQGALNSN